jgi:hypothetical protein
LYSELRRQNQSLRYATHQLKMPMGTVASSDHKMGMLKSAINPSAIKTPQKTLRCILLFYLPAVAVSLTEKESVSMKAACQGSQQCHVAFTIDGKTVRLIY